MGGKAVKPHGPHAAPKGTQFGGADAPAARSRAEGDGFGTGIM